jgi:S1-C subfamily serine protease
MKRKHLIVGMIISAVMMLYGAVQSFGSDPLPTDLITRFELDHYADSQESKREQMISKAMKSVVTITSINESDGSRGTGFFISPNTIVTNYHVIKDKKTIIIRTFGNQSCEVLSTITDSNQDTAIIKTSCTSPYLQPSYTVTEGQDVYSIGHPMNLDYSVAKGILSADRGSWLQFDAVINKGNSGGPLLNSKGEAIGIVSAKTNGDSWYGVAIPMKAIKIDLNLALEKEVPHGNDDTGPNHS